jgi:hypothetical protein
VKKFTYVTTLNTVLEFNFSNSLVKNMAKDESPDSAASGAAVGDSPELVDVLEEGDPVRPGDTLVRATPFVFALQPQFRNKICEYCLSL